MRMACVRRSLALSVYHARNARRGSWSLVIAVFPAGLESLS